MHKRTFAQRTGPTPAFLPVTALQNPVAIALAMAIHFRNASWGRPACKSTDGNAGTARLSVCNMSTVLLLDEKAHLDIAVYQGVSSVVRTPAAQAMAKAWASPYNGRDTGDQDRIGGRRSGMRGT